MKNAKEIDETTVIRTIRTYPREKYVGPWKRGRLYPLYNIVSNNGSKFLSLCGKMKEEPYVIYDKDKGAFYANEGWAIKEMSADSRLTAIGENAASGIARVTASVDGDGASVNVTYGGPEGAKVLDFAFHGLKGKDGGSGSDKFFVPIAQADEMSSHAPGKEWVLEGGMTADEVYHAYESGKQLVLDVNVEGGLHFTALAMSVGDDIGGDGLYLGFINPDGGVPTYVIV